MLSTIALSAADRDPDRGVGRKMREVQLSEAEGAELDVGRYLVIYSIDESTSAVMVLTVRHCMDVYRSLDKIDLAVVARNVGPILRGLSPEPKSPA